MREFLVLMAGKYFLEQIKKRDLEELEALYEIWINDFLPEEELAKRVEEWLVGYEIREASYDRELDW